FSLFSFFSTATSPSVIYSLSLHDALPISDQVFKVLRSSGTTSQQTSRIVLDRRTSMAQSRALVVILQQFLGKARRPMLIIDHPGDRKSTRLNSSHVKISYAVFCLKKKKHH